MTLSNIGVRKAAVRDMPWRLSDEKGLYLEIAVSWFKYWRWKYRFAGKENRLALGMYPEVSLAEARVARNEARKPLASGVNPSHVCKAQKASRMENVDNSFEMVAREWFAKFAPTWVDSFLNRSHEFASLQGRGQPAMAATSHEACRKYFDR